MLPPSRVLLLSGIAVLIACTAVAMPAQATPSNVTPSTTAPVQLQALADSSLLSAKEAARATSTQVRPAQQIRTATRTRAYAQHRWSADVSGPADVSIAAYARRADAADTFRQASARLAASSGARLTDAGVIVSSAGRTSVVTQVGRAVVTTTCAGPDIEAELCALQLALAQARRWSDADSTRARLGPQKWLPADSLASTLLGAEEVTFDPETVLDAHRSDEGAAPAGESVGMAYATSGTGVSPDSVYVTQYGSRANLRRSWGSIATLYSAQGWQLVRSTNDVHVLRSYAGDLPAPLVMVVRSNRTFTTTGVCLARPPRPLDEPALVPTQAVTSCAFRLAKRQAQASRQLFKVIP